MEYLIGAGVALAVCAFGMVAGFDRERVFYPMVLAVTATYYILFSAMGASTRVLALESLIAAAFLVMAAIGFRKSLWVAVAAFVGHGVFDLFRHLFIRNPGVPVWWAGFCLSFDVVAAAVLAVLLRRRSGFASPAWNYGRHTARD